MTNIFRDFSRMDWMGLAGAEVFEDGSEPLIMEDELTDPRGSWMMSIDKNGIEATFIKAGDDFEMKCWSLPRNALTKEAMRRLASVIDPREDNLESLGFERIV